MNKLQEQYFISLGKFLNSENIKEDDFVKNEEIKMLLAFSSKFLLAWEDTTVTNINNKTIH
jgi:hypothetical protein